MRFISLSFVSLLLAGVASAQGGGDIGYPTVAAALTALRARTDVDLSVQGGWTIVADAGAKTYWSFAPAGHAAYPAVVKRTLVERDGALGMQMTALCQASKVACDNLIDEFKAMNERMATEMRGRAGATQAAAPSTIEVQRTGDAAYLLVLASHRSRTPEQGQQELVPKASELCGGSGVQYGRFSFETREPAGTVQGAGAELLLRQHIVCSAVAAAHEAPAADPNWKPSATQVERAERLSRAYFSAKDGGRYQEEYALLSPSMQETTSLASLRANAQKTDAISGAALGRSITKLTWYKNPPQAKPGVYVAVDFSSGFEQPRFRCGFIALHEQPDGAFKVVREEDNLIDQEAAKAMSAEQVQDARAHAGCH